LVTEPELTRVPALDQESKRPPSYGVNYNYIGYISVSRARLRDALYVIRTMPRRFASNVLDALTVYFNPAGQYLLYTANGTRLAFCRYLWPAQSPDGPHLPWQGWLVVAWYLLVLAYGGYVTIRCLGGNEKDRKTCSVVAFMWLTVVYATVVANLTEVWENNRIRFLVDPFAWVIVSVVLQQALALIRVRVLRGR